MHPTAPADDGLTVLWTPLGADGPAVVRASGRVFEALCAARDRRRPLALHHAALEVRLGGAVLHAEMTPVWGQPTGDRGVLAEGPVGAQVLGRSRFFRYEVRCRPVPPAAPVPAPGPRATAPGTSAPPAPADQRTPRTAPGPTAALRTPVPAADPAEATVLARTVLDAAAEVPLLVWGRRAAGTREMWNSNSVIAFLLARAGVDPATTPPPPGARAPGWDAGLALAARCAPPGRRPATMSR